MSISGSYRWVSGDNPVGEIKAFFNNKISEEDTAALCSPDNVISVVVNETGNGLECDCTYTKKPEFNARYEYEFGVSAPLPAPYTGQVVAVRRGKNTIVETITFPDVVYTYTLTFSSIGFTSKGTSSKCGYIYTSFWERSTPSICGFYVMDSHVDADKCFMADCNATAAEVEKMNSYMALRITENTGVYTMTDYFGNGTERTVVFQLGVEDEDKDKDEVSGLRGTHLYTSDQPGHLTWVFKQHNTGKVSIWRGVATDSGMTWTAEKPLNGVPCTINYRRMADIAGSWKTICHSNLAAMLSASGVPASKLAELEAERATTTFNHLGGGVWQYSSDSKAMKMEPICFRSGEEFSFEVEGMAATEIFHLTKDGGFGSTKMAGKTLVFNIKVGKEFMTMEEYIVGETEDKKTIILMSRV